MTTPRRNPRQAVRPARLPGSRQNGEGMNHYLVVFKGRAAKAEQERTALVNEQVRKTEDDLKSLRALVVREHLQEELGRFGEPTAFGMVELVATPRLAARIERASRVKAVIAD